MKCLWETFAEELAEKFAGDSSKILQTKRKSTQIHSASGSIERAGKGANTYIKLNSSKICPAFARVRMQARMHSHKH